MDHALELCILRLQSQLDKDEPLNPDDVKMLIALIASFNCDDDDDETSSFINFYKCPDCGYEWEDTWTAMCDDDCPNCGKRHISPYKSEDA